MPRISTSLLQLAVLANGFNCLLAEFDHLRATSTKCLNNAQCTENAVCSLPQGYCQCRTGYVYVEDICLPVAKKLGDPCIADIQCEIAFGNDAICEGSTSGGSCACQSGSHFAENKCHVSILLGDTCKTRSDCFTTSGANVYCVHSVCTCHQHFHPNSARNDCLPDKMLGDRCKNDDDCVSNDVICYGVCSCKVDFVPAMDFKRCLKVAYRLGEVCEIDTQCLQNLPLAVCIDAQKCGCMEGCHQLEDKCWRTKGLGETCDDWRQCTTVSNLTGSVTCDVKNRCRCTPGYKINEQRDDCVVTNSSSQIFSSYISNMIFLIFITCIFSR